MRTRETNPLISVALCTYNGERYLAEQLQSIFRQTMPVKELVVSDDASTDATLDIVHREVAHARSERLVGDDFELVLLTNQTARGVTHNFEQALRATSHEVILLSDQDDIWHESKVETLFSTLEAHATSLLVFSDATLVDAAGHTLGQALFGALRVSEVELAAVEAQTGFDALMRRNIVTGATVALRRELLTLAGEFPSSWVHDEWLAVVAALNDGLVVCREALTDYRQHGHNEIGASSLTTGRAISRLTQPRAGRNDRLLTRARDLATFVEVATQNPHRLELARNKLLHEVARSTYPRSRLSRVTPVVREYRSRRYDTCGLGLPDVLRDLVQPA